MSDIAPFGDVLSPRPVLSSEVVHAGLVWDVVRDSVDLGEAGVVNREYVQHPGAVAVLALNEQDEVLFIRQYRHPVRSDLWELPAGLLDVSGEPPLDAAMRELREEADVRARRWDVLIDWFNSPGGMDEVLRLYLARDVTPVGPHDLHERSEEELGMLTRWVPLDDARDAVLAGRIHNPGAVVGVLAAWSARQAGWTTLRSPNSPMPPRR